MSKAQPLKAVNVNITGPILVQLHPKNFIETITAKPVPIIRTIFGILHTEYLYIAADWPVAYCTTTRKVLEDVQVDIVTNSWTNGFIPQPAQ